MHLSPGGSDTLVRPGGRLTEVEAPIDLEEIISKYVFGGVGESGGSSGAANSSTK